MVKHVQTSSEVTGIPARDLSDEEFAALPIVLQAVAIDRGIYEIVSETAEPEATKVAEAKPKKK